MWDIKQIKIAEGVRPKSMYIENAIENVKTFYGVFLLQNREVKILVDTGIKECDYKDVCGRSFENYIDLNVALSYERINISEIDAIIMTHLHFDHCGNLKLFKGKKILVQEEELLSLRNSKSHHYVRGFFENVEFDVVSGDIEIAEGVKLLKTPGHTFGTQSIEVKTERGNEIIVGFCTVFDLFNTDRNIGIFDDCMLAKESIAIIKEKADYIYTVHDFGYLSL